MPVIGNLAVRLRVNSQDFTAKMEAGSASVRKLGKAANTTKVEVAQLGTAAELTQKAVAAFAVGKVISFFKDQASYISSVDRTAAALGMETARLAELEYAAGGAGLASGELGKELGKLMKDVGAAAGGSETTALKFERLGLSVRELVNQKPEQVFRQIADRIASIENPAMRAAAATEIFGKQGLEMLPLLSKGAAGIDKAAAEAQKFGLVFSGMDASRVKIAGKELSTITKLANGFRIAILNDLVPPLHIFAKTIAIAGGVLLTLNQYTGGAATKLLAWVAVIGGAVYAGAKIIKMVKGIASGYAAMARAQVLVMALSGPAGWAKLAAGIAAAGIAIYAIDQAYSSVAESATNATNAANGSADAFAGAAAAGDKWQEMLTWEGDADKKIADITRQIRQIDMSPIGKVIDDAESQFGKFADQDTGRRLSKLTKAMADLEAAEKRVKVDEKIADINKELRQFWMTDVEKAVDDLKGMGASADQIDKATDAVSRLTYAKEIQRQNEEKAARKKEVASRVDDLTKDVDQLGMSDVEKQMDNLRRLGATTEELDKAWDALWKIDDAKNILKIEDALEEIGAEADTAFMSATEKRIAELEAMGATAEDIAKATNDLTKIENADAIKKMADEAESVIDSIATPAEKLTKKLDRLAELRNQGLLTDEQYSRAVMMERGGNRADESRRADMITAGSAESIRARYDAIAGMQRMNTKDYDKDQLVTQRSMDRRLKDIADSTRRQEKIELFVGS